MVEQWIENAERELERSDDTLNVTLSVGHLLVAVGALLDVVKEQQRQIDQMRSVIERESVEQPGDDMIQTYERLKEQHAIRLSRRIEEQP